MEYTLKLHPKISKILKKDFNSKERKKIAIAIDNLRNNPRGNNSKKLVGEVNKYRVRVGSTRVLYRIYESEKKVVVDLVARRGSSVLYIL